MSERPILLQADHLKKWFPVRKGVFSKAAQYVKAVDDVSLVIREGETLGIVGESGCGKSTLARTMMRLIEPTEGTVLFQGQDLTSADKESLRRMRRDIQIIFQDPYASLNPRQRVSDILAEPFLIHKLGSREAAMKRAEELLDLVGLSQDSMRKFPHEFSGGQRQRVGIAQALLGNPPFLIFDEPTVGLDPEERIHFRNLFSRTAEEHLVLLSTHIIEDVQSVCDQIVVIHHGTILFTGTPEQLIQSATGHVGVFWEKDETLEQGLHITARVNTSQGIRCRAVADKLPSYAQAEEPSLEDAYLYLISREAAQ